MSSQNAAARGTRPTRARWFDPRLAVGIVLVAVSVTGVVMLVASVDRTITVYAADSTLVIGDVVTASDLVETPMRPGAATERYLSPDGLPDAGVVVTRTVGSGELVPAAAVGDSSSEDWASIVVSVTGELPRSVSEGSLVDVWAAGSADAASIDPRGDSASDLAPGIIASGATVVDVTSDESMVAGRTVIGVELVVPRDRLARMLQSKAAGDFLSLVPTAIPLGG